MRLDYLLIGLTLFSLVIAIGVGFIEDGSRQYGVPIDTETFGDYDLERNLSELSVGQKDKLFAESDASLSFLDSLVKSAKGVFDLLLKPIKMVDAMTNHFTETLGISKAFGIAINSIIAIGVVFGIAYLYFRIRSW